MGPSHVSFHTWLCGVVFHHGVARRFRAQKRPLEIAFRYPISSLRFCGRIFRSGRTTASVLGLDKGACLYNLPDCLLVAGGNNSALGNFAARAYPCLGDRRDWLVSTRDLLSLAARIRK